MPVIFWLLVGPSQLVGCANISDDGGGAPLAGVDSSAGRMTVFLDCRAFGKMTFQEQRCAWHLNRALVGLMPFQPAENGAEVAKADDQRSAEAITEIETALGFASSTSRRCLAPLVEFLATGDRHSLEEYRSQLVRQPGRVNLIVNFNDRLSVPTAQSAAVLIVTDSERRPHAFVHIADYLAGTDAPQAVIAVGSATDSALFILRNVTAGIGVAVGLNADSLHNLNASGLLNAARRLAAPSSAELLTPVITPDFNRMGGVRRFGLNRQRRP